tara:strand:- start:501 stop:701 length:201 start_codon:yes stop_codon:yes gene_type:complete
MKTEDMPTGMLEGKILELFEDLAQVQEDAQALEKIIREQLKVARTELAKRKKPKTEKLLSMMFMVS